MSSVDSSYDGFRDASECFRVSSRLRGIRSEPRWQPYCCSVTISGELLPCRDESETVIKFGREPCRRREGGQCRAAGRAASEPPVDVDAADLGRRIGDAGRGRRGFRVSGRGSGSDDGLKSTKARWQSGWTRLQKNLDITGIARRMRDSGLSFALT